ncbi:MAG: alpha/beta hydrolase, partial [Phycisphaerales bacterium]|nr:alpha/beta hydrolase [Phycisphaerales bacterium]
LLLIAGWWTVLFFVQRSLLFPGTNLPRTTRDTYRLQPGEIETRVGPEKDVTLFILPPKNPPGPGESAPIVVHFHGNYELAQHNLRSDLTTVLRNAGYFVAIPEYRGYDNVPGSPSEKAIVADMVAVIDYLKTMPGVDAKAMVYSGRSLGGGVAVATAKQRPPTALILRSAFTSVADMAGTYLAPSWLVRDKFNNAGALGTMTQPVLIAHAKEDQIVPFEHAERLAKIAPSATTVFASGTHDEFADNDAAFHQAVLTFLYSHAPVTR